MRDPQYVFPDGGAILPDEGDRKVGAGSGGIRRDTTNVGCSTANVDGGTVL